VNIQNLVISKILNFLRMKKKLWIFAFALAIAGYVSAASCGNPCSGGEAKCCEDGAGNTYFMTLVEPN
jgi:hypothetical protein